MQYPGGSILLRRPRSGSLLTSLRRTFRCRVEGAESSSKTKLLVVSRPRASFDAGLLMPRFFHAPRSSLRTFGDAHDLFPPCDVPRSLDGPWSPCGAHVRARLPDPPLRMSSAYEARDCASSLKDGHAPCSSFDAHGVFAFSVPAHALVLRRSRSHSLSDPAVVRLRAFAQKRPSTFPSAFTTKSSWPRSPFRVYRARLSGITGNTSSAHSPRAREFVSRFDEGQRRSSSLRRSRLHLAPGNRARPRLSTMAFALPYSASFHARLATFTSRSCRTLTRFEPARLSTSLLETSHRCACVHLSFRTTSRSPLKPPASLSAPCDA